MMPILPIQPQLSTPRLQLLKVGQRDIPELFALRNDPQTVAYVARKPDQNREVTQAFLKRIDQGLQERKWFHWGIFPSDQHILMGTVCLWSFSEDAKEADIGYDLRPEFQGRGCMGEALEAVIHFAFQELKLNKVLGITHAENESSLRLLNKKGFSYVRPLRADEKSEDETDIPFLRFELQNPKNAH